MFKVGDMVECIDPGHYNSLTKGIIYEVLGYDATFSKPTIYVKGDDGNKGNVNADRFKLANSQTTSITNPPTTNPNSVFKVGDIIEHKIPGECTLRVESINHNNNRNYATHVVFCKNAIYTNTKFVIDMEAAESNYTLVNNPKVNFSDAPKSIKDVKPCTCENLVLFRKGCMCGAVVKQNWGLQG